MFSPGPQGLRGAPESIRKYWRRKRGSGWVWKGVVLPSWGFQPRICLGEPPTFLGEPQNWPGLYLEGKGIKSPTWGRC